MHDRANRDRISDGTADPTTTDSRTPQPGDVAEPGGADASAADFGRADARALEPGHPASGLVAAGSAGVGTADLELAPGDPAARRERRERQGWRARVLAALRTSTALAFAGYLAAAVVVTWHLWGDPASRIVVGNPDDADLFAWYMHYAATALAHGQLPALVTSTLNAPAGINLMWNSSMLLPCIALTPVTLLFGPQVSLTVLTTVGFAGSAAALFWVLRRWQVSWPAAALAGAVYGFSPALLQSAIGHYDLQFAVLPPLIVHAMVRTATQPKHDGALPAGLSGFRPELRRGIGLGLLIVAEIFVTEELALTTVLAGLLLLAVLAAGSPRLAARHAAGACFGLGVAALTTLIVAGGAFVIQFFGPLTQSGTPFLRDFYENDLSGFVTPSGYLLFHTSTSAAHAALYQGQPPEYLAYLGWPLILVLAAAVIALWRRPVIRAVAGTTVVLAVLSLGGHPLVSGASHPGVDLPWYWLENLPLGGSVLPDRFSILLDGTAAVLLALACDAGWQWLRPRVTKAKLALAGALAVLACLPLVPAPLPVAAPPRLPAGWQAALAALRLPAGARILVVPVPEAHLTEAMRWAADSSQHYDLIGGYFIGPAWNGLAYVDGNGLPATGAYLDQLWVAGLKPGSAPAAAAAGANLGQPATPPAPTELRADLRSWRPDAVLAQTKPGSALATYLTEVFGPAPFRTGQVEAWPLTTTSTGRPSHAGGTSRASRASTRP